MFTAVGVIAVATICYIVVVGGIAVGVSVICGVGFVVTVYVAVDVIIVVRIYVTAVCVGACVDVEVDKYTQ